MDPAEPHWRTNSSFSPPPSRRWDCRFQSDVLPQESHEAPLYGSSLSSNSKRSKIRVSSDPYTNHHHSVSDGVLSYFDSPPGKFQPPQWTRPVQEFNFDEFSTPYVGGSRTVTSLFPYSTERQLAAEATAISNSFGSPSSLSGSNQWELTTKQPISCPNRNFSSRRSLMSKPVYPLVYHNPVSDAEVFGSDDTISISKLMPGESGTTPSHWPDNSSSLNHKFHKTLTEVQKMEAFPEPSTSSRREGFRLSNASSYDMGFDGEGFDISEHVKFENLRSPNYSTDQKCGLCGRLLWQKSPWSSYRIVRGDMPIAGVLHCSHVFHAECLEQTTPKDLIHDPPCPLCLKTINAVEESPLVSEPLQMALRSVRRNQGVVISDAPGNNSDQSSDHIEGGLRRSHTLPVPLQSGGRSLIKNHLKKHFTFKGKAGKDFLSTKVFCSTGSLSSSQDPFGRLRSIQSLRK